MQDQIINHEYQRKDCWIKAWAQVAGAINCINADAATDWADKALKAFDERFPPPKPEPFSPREWLGPM